MKTCFSQILLTGKPIIVKTIFTKSTNSSEADCMYRVVYDKRHTQCYVCKEHSMWHPPKYLKPHVVLS